MATVFENRPAPAYTPPQEDAALHNALIKERYEKLKNAEATHRGTFFNLAFPKHFRSGARSLRRAPRGGFRTRARAPRKDGARIHGARSRKDSSRERSRTHQSGFPAVHARNAGQDDSGELL